MRMKAGAKTTRNAVEKPTRTRSDGCFELSRASGSLPWTWGSSSRHMPGLSCQHYIVSDPNKAWLGGAVQRRRAKPARSWHTRCLVHSLRQAPSSLVGGTRRLQRAPMLVEQRRAIRVYTCQTPAARGNGSQSQLFACQKGQRWTTYRSSVLQASNDAHWSFTFRSEGDVTHDQFLTITTHLCIRGDPTLSNEKIERSAEGCASCV